MILKNVIFKMTVIVVNLVLVRAQNDLSAVAEK